MISSCVFLSVMILKLHLKKNETAYSTVNMQVISETSVPCNPLTTLRNTAIASLNEFANDVLGLFDR